MSFPLLPILPQIQYLKPEVPPTVMVDSEQTPFTVFFGLENQAEDQATDDSVQDEAVLEVPFDQLESTAQDTEDSQVFAISDAPNQHTKAPTARPPQTLVESAFFPVAAPTSPDEPAKVLAPLPSQQATPIVLTETRAMASPVAPPKQDDASLMVASQSQSEQPAKTARCTQNHNMALVHWVKHAAAT